jgi:hypothetical protein
MQTVTPALMGRYLENDFSIWLRGRPLRQAEPEAAKVWAPARMPAAPH